MSEYIILSELKEILKTARRHQKSIVLANGCFDILHSEHVNFLKAAKSKGDILIVGVESDQRVNRLKGLGRPVNKLAKRIRQLIDTRIPDFVFPLPEKFEYSIEHEALIAFLRPDILAVSSHTLYLDKKREIVRRYKGELRVVLPHNPHISSSRLLKEI